MRGDIKSDQAKLILFKEWGLRYLEMEEVRRLRSYRDRDRIIRHQLIPFFGSSLLGEIRPGDIERYRSERHKHDGTMPWASDNKQRPYHFEALPQCSNQARPTPQQSRFKGSLAQST